MIDNADDLRDKANEFKVGLKKQYVNIPIGVNLLLILKKKIDHKLI